MFRAFSRHDISSLNSRFYYCTFASTIIKDVVVIVDIKKIRI